MSKIENNPTPSLRALSFVLRNRELWPQDFKWNFNSCSTCAIGMTALMWPKRVSSVTPKGVAKAFNIPEYASLSLFTGPSMPAPTLWDSLMGVDVGFSDISPTQVADRIDAYLNSVEEVEEVTA